MVKLENVPNHAFKRKVISFPSRITREGRRKRDLTGVEH